MSTLKREHLREKLGHRTAARATCANWLEGTSTAKGRNHATNWRGAFAGLTSLENVRHGSSASREYVKVLPREKRREIDISLRLKHKQTSTQETGQRNGRSNDELRGEHAREQMRIEGFMFHKKRKKQWMNRIHFRS